MHALEPLTMEYRVCSLNSAKIRRYHWSDHVDPIINNLFYLVYTQEHVGINTIYHIEDFLGCSEDGTE
jgi:hypothetical protein